jgi:hypothetical protein
LAGQDAMTKEEWSQAHGVLDGVAALRRGQVTESFARFTAKWLALEARIIFTTALVHEDHVISAGGPAAAEISPTLIWGSVKDAKDLAWHMAQLGVALLEATVKASDQQLLAVRQYEEYFRGRCS